MGAKGRWNWTRPQTPTTPPLLTGSGGWLWIWRGFRSRILSRLLWIQGTSGCQEVAGVWGTVRRSRKKLWKPKRAGGVAPSSACGGVRDGPRSLHKKPHTKKEDREKTGTRCEEDWVRKRFNSWTLKIQKGYLQTHLAPPPRPGRGGRPVHRKREKRERPAPRERGPRFLRQRGSLSHRTDAASGWRGPVAESHREAR